MPRRLPTSPLALALLFYRVWRRLPAAQRRRVLAAAIVYAPRLLAQARRLRRTRRRGVTSALRSAQRARN